MKEEQRIVLYDEQLKMEAYHFLGIMQRFSTHFHEHYVVGIIEKGKRRLTLNGKDIYLDKGSIVVFNPYDRHACEQVDNGTLDFRCLNIPASTMRRIVQDITGKEYQPNFQEPVFLHDELFFWIHKLHNMIMEGNTGLEKEETFYFLMEQLLTLYPEAVQNQDESTENWISQKVCAYIDEHYSDKLSLDVMAEELGLNKYWLLRTFTKEKGITPYRYVQTIRINAARELLEQGEEPAAIAVSIGFADQSHFTNTFREFIGVTPKQYQNIFKGKEEGNG